MRRHASPDVLASEAAVWAVLAVVLAAGAVTGQIPFFAIFAVGAVVSLCISAWARWGP